MRMHIEHVPSVILLCKKAYQWCGGVDFSETAPTDRVFGEGHDVLFAHGLDNPLRVAHVTHPTQPATTALHRLPPGWALSNVDGDSNYVRVQMPPAMPRSPVGPGMSELLPEPRLTKIFRLEANLGTALDVGNVAQGRLPRTSNANPNDPELAATTVDPKLQIVKANLLSHRPHGMAGHECFTVHPKIESLSGTMATVVHCAHSTAELV